MTSGITYYHRKKDDLAAACFLRAISVTKAMVQSAAAETGVGARVSRLFELHLAELAAIAHGTARPLIGFSDILALGEPHLSPVITSYVDMFRSVRALLIDPADAPADMAATTARAHLLLSLINAHQDWTRRFEIDDYPRLARLVADGVLLGIIGDGARPVAFGRQLPPSPLPADPTREAFLRAATQLVNDQGYRGASIDKITAVLNATKGKFHHYNDAKIELITACFERSFDLLRNFLDQAEQLDATGAERFVALVDALVAFQLSDRGPLLQGSAFSALPDQKNRIRVMRTRQQLDTRIGSILVNGLVDGSIGALDPALTAELVHAAIGSAAELPRWLPKVDASIAGHLYAQPIIYGLLCAAS